MPSLRARMFLTFIRHSHLLQGQLKPKPILDTYESILEFREKVSKTPKMFGSMLEGIEITAIIIGDQDGGLYAEWIRPTGSQDRLTILYFHGGGYVSGTCEAHHPHLAKIVKNGGIRALLFEYRLAPEHPFPAALDDALAAYRYLLDQGIAPEQIAFMGDSAGGGLCLATLNALKDQHIPLPAAAVALSPWTDLTCSGESYRTNAKTCLSPAGSWDVFSKAYVGDHDAEHPWISPLYGDLAGLPPMRLYVGGDEIMLDDARRYAAKAQAAGVDVALTVGEGLFHCYPICAPIFPEASAAMDEIYTFLRAWLDVGEREAVAV